MIKSVQYYFDVGIPAIACIKSKHCGSHSRQNMTYEYRIYRDIYEFWEVNLNICFDSAVMLVYRDIQKVYYSNSELAFKICQSCSTLTLLASDSWPGWHIMLLDL